jgi:hypothetical protein
MPERWVRTDGWAITVESREPLRASRYPMTLESVAVGRSNMTYEILVRAMQAHGYSLES